MTPAQLATLKTNILTTGPLVTACQPYLSTSHVAIADLFNSLTSAGAGPITLQSVSRGTLVMGMLTPFGRVHAGVDINGAALPTAVQAKWLAFASLFSAADAIVTLSSGLLTELQSAVTDLVATQAEVDAFTKRTGSYGEVLLGEGISLVHEDVTAALAS